MTGMHTFLMSQHGCNGDRFYTCRCEAMGGISADRIVVVQPYIDVVYGVAGVISLAMLFGL